MIPDHDLFEGLSGGIYSRRPDHLSQWVLDNGSLGKMPHRSRLRIMLPIVTIEVFGYLELVNRLYQLFSAN